ncbi:MAG: glycerol kinase GlpK [Lachnospiraceae bacterium]|nr:glycerol kinase GlpK [Lachnospiraceae bacterium]
MRYIISVDQSTQGTKGLLFDEKGGLLSRFDLPHRQIIDENGWVEHDPEEIRRNTNQVIRSLVTEAGIDPSEVVGLGISNQRETVLAWNKETGEPVYNAIVWQCARGEAICRELKAHAGLVQERTGMNLSPYFSAAKAAWILRNVPEAARLAVEGKLCIGTIDAWLIYHFTGGKSFATDVSNAARTQLFNIHTLAWDPEVCGIFGIPVSALPEVKDSNALFGETTAGGFFAQPIPIHAALGDSNGALFGQGCLTAGMTKSTYGTGSSIMMNIGAVPARSSHGLVTSIAWGIDGAVNYVLEGNINYSAASISWLKNDVQLIESAGETEALAFAANPADQTYLVPAFTGLGAPYWDAEATGMYTGMTRTTGKAELVRAALEGIAYQITDIVQAMAEDTGVALAELRVDGGPTRNRYLMQFQSDMTRLPIRVASREELSGIGAAYMAGLALGIYDETVFESLGRTTYEPQMDESLRAEKYRGWRRALAKALYRPVE